MMTLPADLTDVDLLERAQQLRRLALRGQALARGPAHEHEREVRRRFPPAIRQDANTEQPKSSWRFWKS
ncbi:MAG: hypothetical protein JSS14_23410 [Proteobacteria bacterium]|nr:hypothetical protein [Pseudomonadota bacterium]